MTDDFKKNTLRPNRWGEVFCGWVVVVLSSKRMSVLGWMTCQKMLTYWWKNDRLVLGSIFSHNSNLDILCGKCLSVWVKYRMILYFFWFTQIICFGADFGEKKNPFGMLLAKDTSHHPKGLAFFVEDSKVTFTFHVARRSSMARKRRRLLQKRQQRQRLDVDTNAMTYTPVNEHSWLEEWTRIESMYFLLKMVIFFIDYISLPEGKGKNPALTNGLKKNHQKFGEIIGRIKGWKKSPSRSDQCCHGGS